MHFFSKRHIIILLLLPTMVVFITYLVLPLLISVGYSFTDYRQHKDTIDFIGFTNYIDLFRDALFHKVLLNTFIILAILLVFGLPASFLLGLLLNANVKGKGVFKVVNFTPVVMPSITVGLVWLFILLPNSGLINSLIAECNRLFHLHMNARVQWIGGLTLTPYSTGFVQIWRSAGLLAVIFMAGMKLIPSELYESSTLDGATTFQETIYITIPLLKETIKIVTVMLIATGFTVFEIVFALTGGNPFRQSEVLTIYMYNATFMNRTYGYGNSVAVFLLLITMTVSILFLRLTQRQLEQ